MIFKPGFRISIIDTFVIVIAITASTLLHKTDIVFSVAIIFVVGHFFLFCNVFRLSRKPELIWAAIFVLLALAHQFLGITPWFVGIVSFSLTIALVYFETRKPSYHGVFWQKFNPNLPKWFSENATN